MFFINNIAFYRPKFLTNYIKNSVKLYCVRKILLMPAPAILVRQCQVRQSRNFGGPSCHGPAFSVAPKRIAAYFHRRNNHGTGKQVRNFSPPGVTPTL